MSCSVKSFTSFSCKKSGSGAVQDYTGLGKREQPFTMVLHTQRKASSMYSQHILLLSSIFKCQTYLLNLQFYVISYKQRKRVICFVQINLHCSFIDTTLAYFVSSLSKQTCLSLSHQQRSSHKCPCGIFINQTTNLKWIFKALFIPHHSSYINFNALCV